MRLFSDSPDETLDLGRRLAPLLRPGDIVLLSGRLGSGKTLLTAGIAEGLGVQERVVSPSFVLVREYDGFLRIVHADMYRLSSLAELDDLELTEAGREGVVIVEWGDAVASAIPDHLLVTFTITGESTRRIDIVGVGSWADRPLEELTE